MVGRHAPLTAALLVAGGAGAAIGALVAAGLSRVALFRLPGRLRSGQDLPAPGWCLPLRRRSRRSSLQGAGAARGIAVGLVGLGLPAAGGRRRR